MAYISKVLALLLLRYKQDSNLLKPVILRTNFTALAKVVSCVLLAASASVVGYAQLPMQDSLEQSLISATSIFDKIDLNLGLARYHMIATGQGEVAKQYSLEALVLANAVESKKYQAFAYGFIGMVDGILSISSDSLYQVAYDIAKESGDVDAELFAGYLLVERNFPSSAQDSAIVFLKGILSKVNKKTSLKHVGNTYKVLAYAYEQLGRLEEAEEINLKAIAAFEQNVKYPSINPDIGRVSAMEFDGGLGNITQCYGYVAYVYVLKGEYDKARQSADMARTLAHEGGPSVQGHVMSSSARIYQDIGDYPEAISAYQEAIGIFETIHEPLWHGETYRDLGLLYTDMNEFQEAERAFFKADDLFADIAGAKADVFMDLGGLYLKWKKSDKAIAAFIKADDVYQELGQHLSHFKCQLSLAELQIDNQNVEMPLVDIKELLPEIEASKDLALIHKAYLTISKIDRSNGQMTQAIVNAEKALEVAVSRNNDLLMRQESYQNLSNLYELDGQYKNGLFHHKRYKEASDSLITDLALEKLKEQQVSQNVKSYIDEKDSAQQLSEALKSQNTLYILLSSLLALLLAGGSYLAFQLRRSRVKVERQNDELNELNATKDRFFGIIAHDIRSPIAALQSVHTQMSYFAAKGKTDKLIQLSGMVGNTAQRLNSLLDNLLNWAMLQTKAIPYRPTSLQVAKIVEESTELFQTNATEKGVQINMDIDSDIHVMADLQALETIIRNLLSNAIKYSNQGDTIIIGAVSQDGQVSLSVMDTGVGMTTAQLEAAYDVGKKSESGTKGEAGTGLGLVLIHELVALNHGEMKIESTRGEGTMITISLASQT